MRVIQLVEIADLSTGKNVPTAVVSSALGSE